jgi:hypothetical protein
MTGDTAGLDEEDIDSIDDIMMSYDITERVPLSVYSRGHCEVHDGWEHYMPTAEDCSKYTFVINSIIEEEWLDDDWMDDLEAE